MGGRRRRVEFERLLLGKERLCRKDDDFIAHGGNGIGNVCISIETSRTLQAQFGLFRVTLLLYVSLFFM